MGTGAHLILGYTPCGRGWEGRRRQPRQTYGSKGRMAGRLASASLSRRVDRSDHNVNATL